MASIPRNRLALKIRMVKLKEKTTRMCCTHAWICCTVHHHCTATTHACRLWCPASDTCRVNRSASFKIYGITSQQLQNKSSYKALSNLCLVELTPCTTASSKWDKSSSTISFWHKRILGLPHSLISVVILSMGSLPLKFAHTPCRRMELCIYSKAIKRTSVGSSQFLIARLVWPRIS